MNGYIFAIESEHETHWKRIQIVSMLLVVCLRVHIVNCFTLSNKLLSNHT